MGLGLIRIGGFGWTNGFGWTFLWAQFKLSSIDQTMPCLGLSVAPSLRWGSVANRVFLSIIYVANSTISTIHFNPILIGMRPRF